MLAISDAADGNVSRIESLYKQQSPRYVLFVPDRDPNSAPLLSRAGWKRRYDSSVLGPFLTLQQWFRARRVAKDGSPTALVAVTALGGDLGLSGKFTQPEGCALAGIVKSLYIEDTRKPQREGQFKLIDTPADESPAVVADAVLRELSSDDPHVEVGWARGRRVVIKAVAEPIESLAQRGDPRGGTWVVTGGARGITAASAMELGKRFGLKLHLIGRSPVPRADSPWRNLSAEQLTQYKAQVVRQEVVAGRSPERHWEAIRSDLEIYESLKKFAAAGVKATYHSCDLSDWDRLAAVLDEVRHADGPIDGVLHGAGYGFSGRFDARDRERVERTMAGKLDGAVGLMTLTQRDPLHYWIGFGSISGRYGGNGLADYAAANDALAKLVDWFRASALGLRGRLFSLADLGRDWHGHARRQPGRHQGRAEDGVHFAA